MQPAPAEGAGLADSGMLPRLGRTFHVLTHVLPALRRRASASIPSARAQAERPGSTGQNAGSRPCAREGLIEFKSPLAHSTKTAPHQGFQIAGEGLLRCRGGEVWDKRPCSPHRGVHVPARRLANWSTAFFCIVGRDMRPSPAYATAD